MVLRVLQTSGGEACTNQCGWMCETEQCGWVHKAKRSSGLAEWERQRSFVERQSFWVRKAKWSSGLVERLGGAERRLGGAEWRLGGAEQRLGRAGEAAELLGVPLTITPLSELHRPNANSRGGIGRKGMEPKAKARMRRGAPGFLV